MIYLWVEVLQQVHLHAVPQPVLQAEVLPLVLRLALLLDLLVEAHPQGPRAEEHPQVLLLDHRVVVDHQDLPVRQLLLVEADQVLQHHQAVVHQVLQLRPAEVLPLQQDEEVQVPVGAVQVEAVLLVPKKLHQQSQSSNQVQN